MTSVAICKETGKMGKKVSQPVRRPRRGNRVKRVGTPVRGRPKTLTKIYRTDGMAGLSALVYAEVIFFVVGFSIAALELAQCHTFPMKYCEKGKGEWICVDNALFIILSYYVGTVMFTLDACRPNATRVVIVSTICFQASWALITALLMIFMWDWGYIIESFILKNVRYGPLLGGNAFCYIFGSFTLAFGVLAFFLFVFITRKALRQYYAYCEMQVEVVGDHGSNIKNV